MTATNAMQWWCFNVELDCDDNDVKHLSPFVYFQLGSQYICCRRQVLTRLEMIRPVLFHFFNPGSINNRRAPVSIYQNTSPLLLLLVLRCRHSVSDTFHGNYCMKCKIGWKMQNWVKNGQIVRWEANCGDLGQVEREVEEGRWDIWCWKGRWATSLKQSDSFICLSLFGSCGCNCQKWKKHERICQLKSSGTLLSVFRFKELASMLFLYINPTPRNALSVRSFVRLFVRDLDF